MCIRDSFRSPFYDFFAAQETEGHWYNWNGYKSPTILSDEELEYFSIRSTCSVFDITPLNKYRIVGPQAEEFLNKLTVRDVAKQNVATVKYTLWCDQEGFVLMMAHFLGFRIMISACVLRKSIFLG